MTDHISEAAWKLADELGEQRISWTKQEMD